MKFEDFKHLFITALEIAADNAEKELGKSVPRDYEIILHGAGYPGVILSVDKAVASLFISEDRFYYIIDIAVQQVSPHVSRVFVRASDHQPCAFEETWNTPKGSGPFKQLIAQIREVDA